MLKITEEETKFPTKNLKTIPCGIFVEAFNQLLFNGLLVVKFVINHQKNYQSMLQGKVISKMISIKCHVDKKLSSFFI